jgi:hypothetical protein
MATFEYLIYGMSAVLIVMMIFMFIALPRYLIREEKKKQRLSDVRIRAFRYGRATLVKE